jgi:plastocyanin
MFGRVFRVVSAIALSATVLFAADITGSIVIKRTLTKRKVTSNALLYGRGTPVELGRDQGDPLDYERSHTVIFLEGQLPSSGASMNASISMGQEHRRFVPDLVVVEAGSTVSFPNFDPVFHNVFSLSKPKSFDLGNYPKGQTRTVVFPRTGIVFVNCHLHPNMAASIVIVPNRWAVKADGSGRFVLPDVPPGHYTVVAWHKAAGYFRHIIEVTGNGAPHLEFVIPLGAPEPFESASDR